MKERRLRIRHNKQWIRCCVVSIGASGAELSRGSRGGWWHFKGIASIFGTSMQDVFVLFSAIKQMTREEALKFFRSFGAKCTPRHHSARDVVGLQLRYSSICHHDLRNLRPLRREIDFIDLEGTKVTDEGLKHLLCLPFLENLCLSNTSIADSGLKTISRIKTLEVVHLEGTQATLEAIMQFGKMVPGCEVCCDFDFDNVS